MSSEYHGALTCCEVDGLCLRLRDDGTVQDAINSSGCCVRPWIMDRYGDMVRACGKYTLRQMRRRMREERVVWLSL